ncbi:alpha/beta fold hydrolase [Rhodococcus sp. NPDC127530]|uniref:alpha/beta fold hydrolase n=1 Tax=unclassified Rhodococcus (in: high G+C Gram-positive bacteria) TaxID=192944 RepID=UPI0036315B33
MSSSPWTQQIVTINGLRTNYLEAGKGEPLVLLHGGEFGGSAELAWERVIGPLAEHRRVIAPDILGFGQSAKTVDFVDGRGWRLRHLANLCDFLGIGHADFIGNSMGGAMLLADAASANPVLPVRRLISVCGGGESEDNEHMAALMDYDATLEGMRRIVEALFADPAHPADAEYVQRRYESSVLPGAWEAVASARFRRPGHRTLGSSDLSYEAITVPVLLVEGEKDKLKPAGWAQRLTARIPTVNTAIVPDAGHCPQIEQPEQFIKFVHDYLDTKGMEQ